MFIAIGQPLSPQTMKVLRMITLSGSFLFLLRFGTKIIVEANKKLRILEALPLVLFAIWLTILVISIDRLLIGDVTARYLLCAPGAFLTSLGLFLQIPQFKKTKLIGVVRNLQLAAVTFLLYAVLAGLITKKAFFPGADFLTYEAFQNTFGAPVQIFRAGCAVILACSIAYVLSVFRWETQQALYRSEQRCRTIASTMPVILFVQNSDSIITFIQGKGLAVLGLKDDEIIGKRFAQVIPSVPELEENSRRALSGEEFGTTIKINDFAFEFYYLPVSDHDDEVTGLIGVALDVTSMVETQKELDEYRRRMEKTTYLAEVGSMGSVMAQKLNEPLAVTRLMLQRVLADLGGSCFDNDDTDVKSLSKALLEVSKAADIVNRFQNTAQVTSKINAEPVDLYQITKRIIAVFAQSARRANFTISVKDGPRT
jgi:PAS domain S-box-containing protein